MEELHLKRPSQAVPGLEYRIKEGEHHSIVNTEDKSFGDIYYLAQLEPGKYLLLFGDVAGHEKRAGRRADQIISLAQEMVADYLDVHLSLDENELVDILNKRLVKDVDGIMDAGMGFAEHMQVHLEETLKEYIGEGYRSTATGKVPYKLLTGEREKEVEEELEKRGESFTQQDIERLVRDEKAAYVTESFYAMLAETKGRTTFAAETEDITKPIVYLITLFLGVVDINEGKITYINHGEGHVRMLNQSTGEVYDFMEHRESALMGFPGEDVPVEKDINGFTHIYAASDGLFEMPGKPPLAPETYDSIIAAGTEEKRLFTSILAYRIAEQGTQNAQESGLFKEINELNRDDMSVLVMSLHDMGQ